MALTVMLLLMAAFRTPMIALMPDLVPSALRSKANGAINLIGGPGGVLAFLAGGLLHKIHRPCPFWAGGMVTLAAVGVLFWHVKEPRELVASAAERKRASGPSRPSGTSRPRTRAA